MSGRTLTLGEMQQLLEKFTYKPGWVFTLWMDKHEGIKMEIWHTVPCSYSGESRVQSIKTFVPPIHSEEDFWDYLLYRLNRIENHEMREFFRVGGYPIFDPHIDIEGVIHGNT